MRIAGWIFLVRSWKRNLFTEGYLGFIEQNGFVLPGEMPNIKLQSSDGEIFEVDVEIAKASVAIKTMLEDLGMDDDQQEVVQRQLGHSEEGGPVGDPPSGRSPAARERRAQNKEKRTEDINSWDADFLKVDQLLFELILAANYLDIKGLLDVTCKTVANLIKGKTPEDIQHQERLHA